MIRLAEVAYIFCSQPRRRQRRMVGGGGWMAPRPWPRRDCCLLYTLDESEETGQEAGGVLAGICSIQCKHNKYHRTAALERGTVKTFSKLLTVTITGIWAADALYGIFVTLWSVAVMSIIMRRSTNVVDFIIVVNVVVITLSSPPPAWLLCCCKPLL